MEWKRMQQETMDFVDARLARNAAIPPSPAPPAALPPLAALPPPAPLDNDDRVDVEDPNYQFPMEQVYYDCVPRDGTVHSKGLANPQAQQVFYEWLERLLQLKDEEKLWMKHHANPANNSRTVPYFLPTVKRILQNHKHPCVQHVPTLGPHDNAETHSGYKKLEERDRVHADCKRDQDSPAGPEPACARKCPACAAGAAGGVGTGVEAYAANDHGSC